MSTDANLIGPFEPPPYYLDFVDEDIRELFVGCRYYAFEPLVAQLVKELRSQRLLREAGEER